MANSELEKQKRQRRLERALDEALIANVKDGRVSYVLHPMWAKDMPHSSFDT